MPDTQRARQMYREGKPSRGSAKALPGRQHLCNFLQDAVLCDAAVGFCVARAIVDAHGNINVAGTQANRLDSVGLLRRAVAAAAAFTVENRAEVLTAPDNPAGLAVRTA